MRRETSLGEGGLKGTTIGQVRGIGSAHEGAHHWLVMQLTSAGALLTSVYLVVSLLLLPDFSHGTVRDWMSGMGASLAMTLLVVSVFWHARLGLQVMIEDYVHDRGRRFAAMLVLNLVWFAGMVFGLLSLIRIALG